jgi:catechol 2,3-dioxygenase-like lactoylglutathione lyase family enzyme
VQIRLTTVTLSAPDPGALADFYAALLGWEVKVREDDWVALRSPDDRFSLACQSEPGHVPPVWPAQPGAQQMQAHLEIQVDDLEEAGAYARSLGAVLAEHQPQDDVRVHYDPAGHPFCLWIET